MLPDDAQPTEAIRAAFQRQEQLLRLVVDALPALVSYVGADQRYKLVSRTYESWYGTPSQELVGHTLVEIIGEAAYAAILPHLERVFAGHKVNYEASLDLRRRGQRYVRASYLPDFAPDGSVRGFVALVHDITDEKQAEQRLAEEARTREVLARSMPLLVWTTLPNGTIEYANERFLEYSGFSLAELRGGDRENGFIHPSDVSAFNAVWGESLSTGQPFEMEYRLRRADKRYRWFLARGVPVSDDQGVVTRWVGSSTDIDDRKRTEEMQRFLAEAGAMLAGSSRDWVAALQRLAKMAVPTLADVCIIDLVGAAGSIEPLAASAVEAEQWLSTKPFSHGQRALARGELVRLVVESGHSLGSDSDLTPLSTHEDEPISWLVAPMHGQLGTVGAITLASFQPSFHFELRDRRAAEDLGRRAGNFVENARLYELALEERKRAEEASRAKDLFMSTLSHELRTPLSAILGWTRMLQSGTLPADKYEKALATIERNARVQATMIEDVLDLARIASGKLRLEVAPVEISSVVEAALDTIRPTAEAKGVRLQSVLDSEIGILHGDGPRLQQVVWNLLSNAVKFTPKGGRVYVLLRKLESSVEIVVSDTGAGVVSEFLPHVFERFTQADSSRTRQHGGLGLGLAIVKHITELHGGSVSADSKGSEQGATFTVRLPIAPIRDLTTAGRSDSIAPRDTKLLCPAELSGLRVLVVDDEADARELVQSVLETCNVKVSVAKNAAEAFEKLRSERPNVLVSDIGMPDEDGYSLIRRIRALPKEQGGATPAVALTAYAHITDRTRALMEGFHNHVSKPAEPQELIAVVAALVARP